MDNPVSVFKTAAGQARAMAAYDAALACWPVPCVQIEVDTHFGATHLLASGPQDAPPLVLLHGQESSATSWAYDAAAFSRDHRVYALDTINDLGKSRPTNLPASRADYADWLRDVFEALQIEKADLVGHSYGGFLAINFCLAHPQRVRRMALLAPGCPNLGRPTLAWAWYGMPMLMFPSRATVRWFINGVSVKGYSAADPVLEQMAVSVPEMRRLMFLRPEFTDAELRQVAAPILLLVGEREKMYSAQQALARAAELFPDVQAEVVPQASHLLNLDQTAWVDERVVRFFNDPIPPAPFPKFGEGGVQRSEGSE